jgi:hypothetical protein
VGGDSMPCLPGQRRSVLTSLPGAVGNPSIGLPIMVHCRSGGPPRPRPMTTAPEPPLRGERLRPPNQSATNLRLPKKMVLSVGKPSPGEHLPPVAGTNVYDGTIRTA